MVKLAELLTRAERQEDVDPAKEYRLLGVRLESGGPFLRETRLGSQLAAMKLSRVSAGDFIYSRLFAWRGAFGLIPAQLDGCYVSNEFPTFLIHPNRLEPGYILNWFRLASTVDSVSGYCTGSTPLTRNRFKDHSLLALEIPLPPIAEQRRLVGRIEDVEAKVAEARRLRDEAVQQRHELSSAILPGVVDGPAQSRPLVDFISPGTKISYGVLVPGNDEPDGIPFVRVQDLDPTDPPVLPSKRIASSIEAHYARTRLRGDEVLVAVVGATIGKIGTVPPSWAGANIARAVCRIVPGPTIQREFLIAVLRSARVQAFFHETTRTLAQPTLNLAQLQQTPIPDMPLSRQQEIMGYLQLCESKLKLVDEAQSQSARELDAMLPAILDRAFRGEL
jgi:type I restriction enzyme S subunit